MCEIKRAVPTNNIMHGVCISLLWELQVVLQNSEPGTTRSGSRAPGLSLSLCAADYSRSAAQMGAFVMAWAAGHRLCSKEQFHAEENTHSQSTHMHESKCAWASPAAGILKTNVHVECGGTCEWLNNKHQLIFFKN